MSLSTTTVDSANDAWKFHEKMTGKKRPPITKSNPSGKISSACYRQLNLDLHHLPSSIASYATMAIWNNNNNNNKNRNNKKNKKNKKKNSSSNNNNNSSSSNKKKNKKNKKNKKKNSNNNNNNSSTNKKKKKNKKCSELLSSGAW